MAWIRARQSDCGYCGEGAKNHAGRVDGGVCVKDADVLHCAAATGASWGAGVGNANYARMKAARDRAIANANAEGAAGAKSEQADDEANPNTAARTLALARTGLAPESAI